MSSIVHQAWRDTLDVVFPRSCVNCSGLVEGGRLRHLCPDCEKTLHIVSGPHCTHCGHPFYGEMVDNRLCPHCEALVPEFGEGRTAVLLKGSARALVHALKYHKGQYVLEDIATIMAMTPDYVAYLRGAVLVPVPLHPRKLRERGYNQSRLLAECCCAAFAEMEKSDVTNEPQIEELLRRVLDTESQTHFDRATRQLNLKNAFALASGAAINAGQRYILIDDVFTTGSTLNACAAVLRNAGCVSLDVITFGHG